MYQGQWWTRILLDSGESEVLLDHGFCGAEAGLWGAPGIGNWTNAFRFTLGGLCEHVSRWVSGWTGLLLYWVRWIGLQGYSCKGIWISRPSSKARRHILPQRFLSGLSLLNDDQGCPRVFQDSGIWSSMIAAQVLGRWDCSQVTAETGIRWISSSGSASITDQ